MQSDVYIERDVQYCHEFSKEVLCINISIGWNFSGGSVVKNSPANARDTGSIPELGRPLGEGNGNSLQYSCLGSPMDIGAWWATVHGVPKDSDTTW